jgi:hypothetical protein
MNDERLPDHSFPYSGSAGVDNPERAQAPQRLRIVSKSVAMGYSAYYHRHKSWLTAAGMLSLALFVAPWNFIQVDTKSGNYISLMVGAVFVRPAINMRPTTSQSNKQNRSSSVP